MSRNFQPQFMGAFRTYLHSLPKHLGKVNRHGYPKIIIDEIKIKKSLQDKKYVTVYLTNFWPHRDPSSSSPPFIHSHDDSLTDPAVWSWSQAHPTCTALP